MLRYLGFFVGLKREILFRAFHPSNAKTQRTELNFRLHRIFKPLSSVRQIRELFGNYIGALVLECSTVNNAPCSEEPNYAHPNCGVADSIKYAVSSKIYLGVQVSSLKFNIMLLPISFKIFSIDIYPSLNTSS